MAGKDKDSSCASASEDLSGDDESVSEVEIRKILAEEILDCEVLGRLPPTPVRGERQGPRTRASSSLSSVASSFGGGGGNYHQLRLTPTPSKSEDGGGDDTSSIASSSPSKSTPGKRTMTRTSVKKMREKDICKALGFEMDEAELEEMERDEDRIPVDNVIEDILNLGLGKGKGSRTRGGRIRTGASATAFTVKEEDLMDQYGNLRGKKPLDITTEGRVAMLKEDVQTVRTTKEKVDALIRVLERTRDRLVNGDSNLVYTEPPLFVKTNKDAHHRAGVGNPKP